MMAGNEKTLDEIRAAMTKVMVSPQTRAAFRRAGYEISVGRVIPVSTKVEPR